jgi:hypothetical protein
MKLTELDPKFLKRVDDHNFNETDLISEADGIMFLCPVCFKNNNGSKGTHSIICWQPHVPQTTNPIPGRWNFLGTGYDDLELQAGSSSIFLEKADCAAHFFIRNGQIE